MKNKIFIIILSGLLFFAFSVQTAVARDVYVTEVDGEIKAGTLQYLKRAVKEAEKAQAEYLIIKLDTPGGLLKSTKDIVDLLLSSRLKTIVFVHKEGGWAYSAGTFILLAADYAVSHPGASIGAAQPREMAMDEIREVDPKLIEGMASWMKGLAERNKRNSEVAEKFVRENLTLTGREAKEAGVIDETAGNLDELFLKLGISEPKITQIQPSPIERFFDFLSHPYLISLFLTVGGLAIILAIRSGEFELSGVIGVIALLIGLWGMGVITFSFLGIGLLLLGLILLLMEIFVEPGFGVLGILGAGAILLGIFTFEAEPFLAPEIFDAVTMIIIGAILAVSILFIVIGRGVAKTLKTRPKTGAEALIGLEAEVIKELNPLGQVILRNELWQAESASGETILKGEKVKIIKIEGNTLFVGKI